MMQTYESKIGKADTKGKSSRTIVPREVVRWLDLEWGDSLVWAVDIKGENVTVTVSKKESSE
jgi:hypothetical protein